MRPANEYRRYFMLLKTAIIEKLGYNRTQVFFDGWHAWNGAGYPFVIGDVP